MSTGIDPMRLHEIEEWHPGMLASLDRAHRDRWTHGDEARRTLVLLMSLVRREQLALGGVKDGDLPDPVEILRPGEEPPRPRWAQQMDELANGGGG